MTVDKVRQTRDHQPDAAETHKDGAITAGKERDNASHAALNEAIRDQAGHV
jgi:hypothetical protein